MIRVEFDVIDEQYFLKEVSKVAPKAIFAGSQLINKYNAAKTVYLLISTTIDFLNILFYAYCAEDFDEFAEMLTEEYYQEVHKKFME